VRKVNFLAVVALLLSIVLYRSYWTTDLSRPIVILCFLAYLPYIIFVVTAVLIILQLDGAINRETLKLQKPGLRSLALVTVLSVIFFQPLSLAKEILHFNFNRSQFYEAANAAKSAQCFSQSPIYCKQFVSDIPFRIKRSIGTQSLFVLAADQVAWIAIHSRFATNFVYIEQSSTGLGSRGDIAGYHLYCFYQLDDKWFLCDLSIN
jgi:hypothetical protein